MTMTDFIVGLMGEYGYAAVFLLMVLENVFPPIPSEVILPYVGHLATIGELNFFAALAVAALGSLIGTSFWFALGWLVSAERLKVFFSRYGGYIAITVKDFERGARFFQRHERSAVFFGRMIPAVRSVISIPAGVVHMPIRVFVAVSLTGIVLWNTLLISVGYLVLSDIHMVERYVNPVSDLVLLGFAGAYMVQVIRFIRQRNSQS